MGLTVATAVAHDIPIATTGSQCVAVGIAQDNQRARQVSLQRNALDPVHVRSHGVIVSVRFDHHSSVNRGHRVELVVNHCDAYPPNTPIQHTTPTSSAVISSFSGAFSTFRSPNILTISTILFAAPVRVIFSPSSNLLTSPSARRTG